MPEFTGHRDLREYLRVLWRFKLLFLVFAVGAPVAAYLIERGKPTVYRSTALVGVNQATVDTSLLSGSATGSFSTSNVTAIAELVKTTPVADVAAALLRPRANPSTVVREVTATGDPLTNFITISAEDQSSQRAAAIANAFARAIGLNRRRTAVSELDSGIAGITTQLAHLSPRDTTTRPALAQQLNQLNAARSTQGSVAAILQPAFPSLKPAGPHLRRTVEIGLLIGVLLGFGAITLAQNADRRLRAPEDLEGMTDLPLLSAIASSAFSSRLDTALEDDEAFQTLRTALIYFNLGQPLNSILVTSPGEQEGKTTVATRLALAAARAGEHVALVDADLRRAQVGAKLRIRPGAGLEAVLAGELTLADALVEYPIDEPRGGRLTVLPAGPKPPSNPTALIDSPEMQGVLGKLVSWADLVIVDTPAALAVSDSLPLMRTVSGVLLVARMNRSNKSTIRRLQRTIVTAHGTLVGIVATGVSKGPGYEGYGAKYYAPNAANGSGRLSRLRGRRSERPEPEPRAPLELDSDWEEPGVSAPPRAEEFSATQNE